mmetsp:Transcript_15431/g.21517  ORF Transcript_15431/g.21517 Transcript_15431/m.21517 type:complete len:99 (-) Transcript_15431:431-727(-)
MEAIGTVSICKKKWISNFNGMTISHPRFLYKVISTTLKIQYRLDAYSKRNGSCSRSQMMSPCVCSRKVPHEGTCDLGFNYFVRPIPPVNATCNITCIP